MRNLVTIYLSSMLENISLFDNILGEPEVVATVTYVGGGPAPLVPEIVKKYSGFGGELYCDGLRIQKIATCLEIIRNHKVFEILRSYPLLNVEHQKHLQSTIGMIIIVNPDDLLSVKEAVDTIKMLPDLSYVVAVRKIEKHHRWHNKIKILNSPDTLYYDLDDIQSIGEIYKAIIRKMPIAELVKQGFLDCIESHVQKKLK